MLRTLLNLPVRPAATKSSSVSVTARASKFFARGGVAPKLPRQVHTSSHAATTSHISNVINVRPPDHQPDPRFQDPAFFKAEVKRRQNIIVRDLAQNAAVHKVNEAEEALFSAPYQHERTSQPLRRGPSRPLANNMRRLNPRSAAVPLPNLVARPHSHPWQGTRAQQEQAFLNNNMSRIKHNMSSMEEELARLKSGHGPRH